MKGYQQIKNPQGIDLIKLHYSADPNKDPDTKEGKAWLDEEEKNWPGGGRKSLRWRREMEIDCRAGVGELVFPTFDELDLVVRPFSIEGAVALYGGFDWGYKRNPTSFHVYAHMPDRVSYSIWEYYDTGRTVPKVAEYLWKNCPYMKELNWVAADPSIWAENQSSERGITSIGRMFLEEVPEQYKVECLMPAKSRSDEAAISTFDMLFSQGRFKFFNTCSNQIDEFRNLKYPEQNDNLRNPKNPTEKILDKNNHAWDDAKYFIMSHPEIKRQEKQFKFGTYGYINEISRRASQRAELSGRSTQEEFYSLYGET